MDDIPAETGPDFWRGDQGPGGRRLEPALAAVRSAWQDLRRLPLLALTTAVVVSIATLSVLAAPLLNQLTVSAATHVTEHSELVIAVDPVANGLMDRIDGTPGVGLVRPSTEEDLERVGSSWNSDLARYTILPTGVVPVETLQGELLEAFPEIVAMAHTVGIESGQAIDLLEIALRWLSAGLSVAGLLIILYLGLMVGRLRAEEAETMGLIGSTPFDIWLRLGSIVFIPTVLAVVATSAVILIAAPALAASLLSRQAATQVSSAALLGTVWLLLVSAAAISAVSGYLGMRMRRRAA